MEQLSERLIILCVLCAILPADPVAIGLQQLAKSLGLAEKDPLRLSLPAQLILIFPYTMLLGIVAGYIQPARAISSLFEFESSIVQVSRVTLIRQSRMAHSRPLGY